MCASVDVQAEEVTTTNSIQLEQPQMASFNGGNLNDFKVWVEAEMAKRTTATNKAGRVIVAFKVMADGTIEVNDKPAMNSQADEIAFSRNKGAVMCRTLFIPMLSCI